MKVLLIIPDYAKGKSYALPLGIMYISSYLKTKGFEVHLLNLNHLGSGDLKKALCHNYYDVVGTGGLFTFITEVQSIVEIIRKNSPQSKIVLGGAIASADPEFALRELQPDFLVLGEGEITTNSLLCAISSDDDPAEVNGIAFLRNGSIVETPPGPLIEDLDLLPFPDYEGFGFDYFLDKFAINRPYYSSIIGRESAYNIRTAQILTSRDCPMKCTFCFRTLGGGYRLRSITEVIREIDYLVDNYNINEVLLVDDMFSAKKERVFEFCEAIKKYDLRWYCQLRVNMVSEAMLEAMKGSGCQLVSYGFESGSPVVLKSMKKGITPAQIENAVNLTKKSKMEIQGNFIFGDPAETLGTMKTTMDFIDRVFKTTLIWTDMVVPYPGTDLYHDLVKRGEIQDRNAFYREADGSLNMTSLSQGSFTYLREYISAFSAMNRGRFTSKKTKIETLRSGEFDITSNCPFCGMENQYYFDLNRDGAIGSRSKLLVLCRDCRQRFFVGLFQGRKKEVIVRKLVDWYSCHIKWNIFRSYPIYRVSLPFLKCFLAITSFGFRCAHTVKLLILRRINPAASD
jgi:anaerobic magnesium-protoporphyrin IX monomethyl ester cyclase